MLGSACASAVPFQAARVMRNRSNWPEPAPAATPVRISSRKSRREAAGRPMTHGNTSTSRPYVGSLTVPVCPFPALLRSSPPAVDLSHSATVLDSS